MSKKKKKDKKKFRNECKKIGIGKGIIKKEAKIASSWLYEQGKSKTKIRKKKGNERKVEIG